MIISFGAFAALFGIGDNQALAAPVLAPVVLATGPHASDCYSQGIFFFGGDLYESCGLYGKSSFTRWPFPRRASAEPLRKRSFAKQYFAEGAAEAEDEIYVLTWREKIGFVLDPATLMIKREFSFTGEGWGLAWDGKCLWRSDGSARLYPHRAGDFTADGEAVTVRDAERDLEISGLNELEWDDKNKLLLANIYGEDLVAAIDPSDGTVRFWLDTRALRTLAVEAGLPEGGNKMDTVLNGLALAEDGLWLTGKLWPVMYKIAWPPAGLEGAIEGRTD